MKKLPKIKYEPEKTTAKSKALRTPKGKEVRKEKVLRGYKEVYKSSGKKKYNWNKRLKEYKKTGFFRTKISGSGHEAGFKWAEKKQIDPHSPVRRYGKNSPSFDEGVYGSKERRRAKSEALKN